MSQVTLYLDEETATALSNAAAAAQVSKSKWVASLIRKNAKQEWPEEVSNLAGSWAEFPSQTDLRSFATEDVKREEW